MASNTFTKAGEPFLYDIPTGKIVGFKDTDGSDVFIARVGLNGSLTTSPYGPAAASYPCQVATTNALAPQDATGNGLHSTFGAGLTAAAGWATNGCITLGGAANQYFQSPMTVNLGADCFILALQIQIAAPPGSGTPMFAGSCDQTATARGWYLGVNTSGVPRLYVKDQSTPTSLLGGGQIADGAWHTVVAAFDGANKGFFAWVDGVLQIGGSSGMWTGDASSTSTTSGATFGAQTTGQTAGIATKMKNVEMWKGSALPLNLNDIAMRYNATPSAIRSVDMAF